MQLDVDKFRGKKLQEILPHLEKLNYKLKEVSPPNQDFGTGAARVLHLRKKQESWEILFTLENYV